MSLFIFAIIVIILLILDLGFFNKSDKKLDFNKSLKLSIFYISVACFYGLYVHYYMGAEKSAEYFTGFFLEKAMAVDNIFVISMIFRFFAIPDKYTHRVLFWGIIGVIVLRGIMISIGATLIAQFSWMMFIFAVILIYTGFKTFKAIDQPPSDLKDMYLYKILSKHLNILQELRGNKFIVHEKGKLWVTPLFMALITVEAMDLVFAIDSIPAIFVITQDTTIIYTSNIFAILGLRAMFFLLEDMVERFKYLKYSLALILVLIGMKIIVSHFIDIPKLSALFITILILAGGVIASLRFSKK